MPMTRCGKGERTLVVALLVISACKSNMSSDLCGVNNVSPSVTTHQTTLTKTTEAESILALWPHATESTTADTVKAKLVSSLARLLDDAAEATLIQVMLKRDFGSLPAVAAYVQLRLRPQPLATTLPDTSLDDRSRLNVFSALSLLEAGALHDGTYSDSARVGPARVHFACELARRSEIEPSDQKVLAVLAAVLGRLRDERDAGSRAAGSVLADQTLSRAVRLLERRGYL